MSTGQKTGIALIMALFAGWAGTTFAAAAAQAAGSPELFGAAATPFPAQDPPPDCKRKPDDPRCGKKPY